MTKILLKKCQISAIRVLWFRQSALQTRWHEELLLVPEEMARTVRFFYAYEARWASIAQKEASRDGARAGYARKYVLIFPSRCTIAYGS